MNFIQKEFSLCERKRGFHLITDEVLKNLPELENYNIGTLNLFIKHTSASLTINENCDPTVRLDMENYVNDVISNKSYFEHTYEGEDDMLPLIKYKSQNS